MSVNLILVMTGVNMGDHGETVRKAVDVAPGETVEQAAERILSKPGYSLTKPGPIPQYEWHLEVRLIEPVEQP